jgi:hypothetical protein
VVNVGLAGKEGFCGQPVWPKFGKPAAMARIREMGAREIVQHVTGYSSE